MQKMWKFRLHHSNFLELNYYKNNRISDFTLEQVLSLYQIGVCYFCFDNFLCIMNLHAAGQFRILQHRLTHMNIAKDEESPYTCPPHCAVKYYAAFKGYVKEHQVLIAYCDKLEEVFNLIVLGQVLMFSLLICLDGYQVLTVSTCYPNVGRIK